MGLSKVEPARRCGGIWMLFIITMIILKEGRGNLKGFHHSIAKILFVEYNGIKPLPLGVTATLCLYVLTLALYATLTFCEYIGKNLEVAGVIQIDTVYAVGVVFSGIKQFLCPVPLQLKEDFAELFLVE